MVTTVNNKIRLGNLLIPDAYSEVHGYDLAGNITSIQRNAITNFSNHTVSQIDNLAYIYQGGSSRLQSVSDAAPGGSQQMGYKPGSSTFSYDNAGNIITESGKQLGIQYNPIDLPQQITTPDGNIYIDYTFAGEKLQTYDARALPIPLDGARRWYMGAIEFKSLGRLVHHYPEGRIVEDPSKGGHWREYTLQDHLGNTVVTYADLNANGKVDANEALQHNYYYAFGMQINGNWQSVTPGSPNKYLYNGKELHDWAGLNWSDYGARWYMPELGRFTGVDPIAAQYAHVSTYNYAENEPVGHIDLWGLQAILPLISSSGAWLRPYNNFMLENNNVITRTPVMDKVIEAGNVGKQKFTPEQLQNFSRGRSTEIEQLANNNLTKNNKQITVEDPKTGKDVTTVPDAFNNGGKSTVEIKNVKNQSLTKQLRAQEKYSNDNGLKPELIINESAKLSKNLENSTFDIKAYEQMTPIDNTRVNVMRPVDKKTTD